MTPKRLAVVHWFPIEYYPPVTNILNYFSHDSEFRITCFTSHNTKGREPFLSSGCPIYRYGFPQQGQTLFRRIFFYVLFPVAVFLRLLWFRPQAILYMEPQSVMPVFLYTLLARRCRIFIHNHEYHDQHQFLRPGMRLVRIYHWLEKKYIFRKAVWISQTNADRIQLFRKDFPNLDPARLQVLPNLPPRSWRTTINHAWETAGDRLRLVYVGSLSVADTFIREVVDWMDSDAAEDCELDVFSYNQTPEVRLLFEENTNSRVRFYKEGVAYGQLPVVLSRYHVGLILYKANTTNYVFNASNKLFEYLALGLDVWFPGQMLGVKPYSRTDRAPRVIEVAFDKLSSIDLSAMMNRGSVPLCPSDESCETALESLRTALLRELS
jgi:hypothetical protein